MPVQAISGISVLVLNTNVGMTESEDVYYLRGMTQMDAAYLG
jgi:hypothetical protein